MVLAFTDEKNDLRSALIDTILMYFIRFVLLSVVSQYRETFKDPASIIGSQYPKCLWGFNHIYYSLSHQQNSSGNRLSDAKELSFISALKL